MLKKFVSAEKVPVVSIWYEWVAAIVVWAPTAALARAKTARRGVLAFMGSLRTDAHPASSPPVCPVGRRFSRATR